MSVNTRLDSSTKTLHIDVSGRFDFALHQDFRRASEQAKGEVHNIIVDLDKVDYLDSSALGMLLVLRDRVGGSKSAIKIKNINPDVRNIFEIANFSQLFTLE